MNPHEPNHIIIIQISEALSSLRLHPWGFQLVLLQGVCESIANGQAFQRDLLPLTCLQGLQTYRRWVVHVFNHEKGISEYLYSIYSTMLYQYIIVYHSISIQCIYKMFGISIPKSKEGSAACPWADWTAGWWRLVAAPNAVADGGHIVSCCDGLQHLQLGTGLKSDKVSSCIGFSKDVEVGALVLLELSKELLQEPDHGTGDPMCRLKRRSVQTCVLSFKDLQTPGPATLPLNAGKSK